MKIFSKILPCFLFPGLVFVAHVVASKMLNLYLHFPNLDVPFHYVGGLSIAYTASQILTFLEKEQIPPNALTKGIFLVLLLSLTATATVFWEFAEFAADQLLETNMQINLANTMQDQFLGILGGITWVFVHARRWKGQIGQRVTLS